MNDRKTIVSQRRQQLIRHDDGNAILVDYYPGAYGPTLRLDVQRPESLARLRGLLAKLADGRTRRASMDEVGQVIMCGVAGIEMVLCPGRTEPRKLVELVEGGEGGPLFRWTRYSEGWKEWAELLDGLKGPGHQYLTGKNLDDAIIRVSFLESPDLPDSSEILQ